MVLPIENIAVGFVVDAMELVAVMDEMDVLSCWDSRSEDCYVAVRWVDWVWRCLRWRW